LLGGTAAEGRERALLATHVGGSMDDSGPVLIDGLS
jgi:hypothetical protein